jgi:NADH:ubiquinone oxidoreductase subunit 3 (subunit A)
MLQEYLPILIFLGVAAGLGVLLLVLGFLIGQGQKDAEKLSPYECGFEAFDDSRMKFDVRYYLVAILFIIFDLEIAFLFPASLASFRWPCSWLSLWSASSMNGRRELSSGTSRYSGRGCRCYWR